MGFFRGAAGGWLACRTPETIFGKLRNRRTGEDDAKVECFIEAKE
jgi:hypothetical protein